MFEAIAIIMGLTLVLGLNEKIEESKERKCRQNVITEKPQQKCEIIIRRIDK